MIAKEVEEVKESFVSFDVSDSLPPVTEHRWFPGLVLDLAARFAILFIVQTAVAVWFLSREDVKEVGRGSNEDGFKEKKKVIGAVKEMAVEDFERMVAEIRKLASDARKREAETNVDGRGVEEGSKGARLIKKSIARIFMGGLGDEVVQKRKPRKLKLRNRGVGNFPKSKGFGGSKQIRTESGIGKGGIQKIRYMNPVKESAKLRVFKKSDAQTSNQNKKSSENEDIKKVEKLPYVNNCHIEDSKRSSENSMSNESMESGTEDSQKNLKSSMLLTRNERGKESRPGSHENQWWIKLHYVFGIFLHRGSKSLDKGLYSLRMNSAAHDGKQYSYTITFQDRGDAINFSFLLESFFEDLGNVSADVVPLTIHELDDAIRSGDLKLIVARKGQLALYAGQPLDEVENALRSLLE